MDQQKHTTEDTLTDIFGSKEMRSPAPTEFIPKNKTAPEIAYQLVKDETYPQTQPRLNLATFVTTYMDDYATRLMNEAININYIDETEYPRVAVMCGRCLNIVANMWNSPEKAEWKTGALGIGSSEACMLGGVAAWLRWRARRKAAGKPFDKPNLVMSTGFQVVWEKFCQLWQIEMRTVPLTLDHPTLDTERGAGGLRREHHLHRAHRRRDVDGSRRRHRGARQGARRLQRQDGLRNPDPRRRGVGRFHPAVPTTPRRSGTSASNGCCRSPRRATSTDWCTPDWDGSYGRTRSTCPTKCRSRSTTSARTSRRWA